MILSDEGKNHSTKDELFPSFFGCFPKMQSGLSPRP